jgi:hypothetical protein
VRASYARRQVRCCFSLGLRGHFWLPHWQFRWPRQTRSRTKVDADGAAVVEAAVAADVRHSAAVVAAEADGRLSAVAVAAAVAVRQ